MPCNFVIGQYFATRNQAKLEIFTLIEGFYNRQRMHSTLDCLSPDSSGNNTKLKPHKLCMPVSGKNRQLQWCE